MIKNIIITGVYSLLFVSFLGTINTIDNLINPEAQKKNISKNTIVHQNNTPESLNEYITKLEDNELNNILIYKISEYIKYKNNKLSEKYTNKLAKILFEESLNFNINIYDLISLIETESTFDINVTHAISDVRGLGGTYWKWWKEDLIKNKIVKNRDDLLKLRSSVQATCYVINHYKEKYNNNKLEYLTAYKGKSNLGKKRAQIVITKAKIIEKYIKS